MATLKCDKCPKAGSEGDLKRCSRCKSAVYCSQECQLADWKAHKPVCQAPLPSGLVMGVIIPCEGDKRAGRRGIFQAVEIQPSDEIHRLGVPSPVLQRAGLPIVIYRHLKEDPLSIPRTPNLDNQIATYLMIDPDSGMAPPHWQQGVGTVTVMRRDGRPLSIETIETIWMYCDSLLDDFGSVGDGWPHPRRRMNPAGFERFCRNYKNERVINGYTGFNSMSVPL